MFLSISQRYILKANHNKYPFEILIHFVFINKSKIHFESKSQPPVVSITNVPVFINKSKIHFESKSQHKLMALI